MSALRREGPADAPPVRHVPQGPPPDLEAARAARREKARRLYIRWVRAGKPFKYPARKVRFLALNGPYEVRQGLYDFGPPVPVKLMRGVGCYACGRLPKAGALWGAFAAPWLRPVGTMLLCTKHRGLPFGLMAGRALLERKHARARRKGRGGALVYARNPWWVPGAPVRL